MHCTKIADFSSARVMSTANEKGRTEAMTVGFGTLDWMAPELISGDGHYGEGVDVYGFGMMLYAMLTLTEPHQAMRTAVNDAKTTSEAHTQRFEDMLAGKPRGVPAGLQTLAPPSAIAPAALIHALCIQKLRPRLDHNSKVPTPLIKLIKSAWHHDPQSRPSFQQVLEVLRDFDKMNVKQGSELFPSDQARRRLNSQYCSSASPSSEAIEHHNNPLFDGPSDQPSDELDAKDVQDLIAIEEDLVLRHTNPMHEADASC
jgi:serine/threonine protein kinase